MTNVSESLSYSGSQIEQVLHPILCFWSCFHLTFDCFNSNHLEGQDPLASCAYLFCEPVYFVAYFSFLDWSLTGLVIGLRKTFFVFHYLHSPFPSYGNIILYFLRLAVF